MNLLEKRLVKNKSNTNWLLLSISTSLLSITIIVIAFLATVMKRRTSNGYWSRETDLSKRKSSSKLCRFFGFNENDSYDSTTYSNLELKQCHLNKDISCLMFNSNTTDRLIDEYSTSNSIFGTIDRLVVKDQNGLVSSSGSAASTSSSSATSASSTSKINPNKQNTHFTSKINSTSTSYFVNQQDDSFDKSEIHF